MAEAKKEELKKEQRIAKPAEMESWSSSTGNRDQADHGMLASYSNIPSDSISFEVKTPAQPRYDQEHVRELERKYQEHKRREELPWWKKILGKKS